MAKKIQFSKYFIIFAAHYVFLGMFLQPITHNENNISE